LASVTITLLPERAILAFTPNLSSGFAK